MKRTQIAAVVCALLLIPFEFLYLPVSWALDPLFEGGFGYYGAAMLCIFFRYCWIAGTLLLALIALIALCVLRRRNPASESVNPRLTAAAIVIPPLVSAATLVFGFN